MFDVFLWNLAKLWYMDLTLLLLQWKYGFISVYAALCTWSLHAIPTELHPSNLKWKLNMIQTETDIHHTSSYILHSLVFGFFILNLTVHTLIIKVPARASVNAFLRIGGLDTEQFKNLKISSPTSTPRDEACLPNGCLLALGETQIGKNLGLEEIPTKEKQFATVKLLCWSCEMVQDFRQAFHPKTFRTLIHTISLQRTATEKSTILTSYLSSVDSTMQPAQRNKPWWTRDSDKLNRHPDALPAAQMSCLVIWKIMKVSALGTALLASGTLPMKENYVQILLPWGWASYLTTRYEFVETVTQHKEYLGWSSPTILYGVYPSMKIMSSFEVTK